jgi:hypothetical protein
LYRYPNNIAIVKDPSHVFGCGVVWVTDLVIPNILDKGNAWIKGHYFKNVDDLTTHPVPSHLYETLLASDPNMEQKCSFHIQDVKAKGMALHLDPLEGRVKSRTKLSACRKWMIDIIDYQSM